MLTLTRKKGESIMIADDIEITLLSIQKEQVKIGVKAPKTIPVHRKEIYEQIMQENTESSKELNIAALDQLFS